MKLVIINSNIGDLTILNTSYTLILHLVCLIQIDRSELVEVVGRFIGTSRASQVTSGTCCDSRILSEQPVHTSVAGMLLV